MTKQNIIELLTNEGVCVIDKKSYLLITDVADNKATVKIDSNDIIVSDKFGNRDTVNKDDLKGLIFTVFSALETEYNYTTNYLNQFLLDCETGQNEVVGWLNGNFEEMRIVDVLGIVEEKGRVYVGVEVVTNDYPFGHIIHVNFMNVWDFVYKDEMVEIQDTFTNALIEKLKIDLGIKDNILDDVKNWIEENTQSDEKEETELLSEIINYGVENVAPSHLIYNDDIQNYYSEHEREINIIVEEETGYNINDAIEDIDAFEVIINSVGGINSELEFEDSHELENSELRYFVWLAFEHVAFEYLTALKNK